MSLRRGEKLLINRANGGFFRLCIHQRVTLRRTTGDYCTDIAKGCPEPRRI